MPFINTKVTTAISLEQETKLRSELGKAIAALGKTESWLMLGFEDNCRLHFQGNNNSPSAFIEIKLFGKASDSAYDKMTALVTDIISSELAIPANRIYVKYEECSHWGWNSNNF